MITAVLIWLHIISSRLEINICIFLSINDFKNVNIIFVFQCLLKFVFLFLSVNHSIYKYNAIWWIGFRLFKHFTDMLGRQNECLAWIIVWGLEISMKWRQQILENENMKESLLCKKNIIKQNNSGEVFEKQHFC